MYGIKYPLTGENIECDKWERWGVIRQAFLRLIFHNGQRIRHAFAREMKWLGLSLLWCWIPLRHWLEPRIGKGYLFVALFTFLMVAGALLEIALCFYERNSLPKRFEKFKISTIRHFSARPRSPVSRTETTEKPINFKFWGVFLAICLAISCIVPVSSSWVIVHPLGGKDYLTSGPTFIRPFSSWRTVPKTHQATLWIPLRLIEERNSVVILELEVEWRVTKPLQFKPREWHIILDRAVGWYIGNIMENMKNAMATEVQDEDAQEVIIIYEMGKYLKEIATTIEDQIGSPEPMKIIGVRIRTISLSAYSLYYQAIRQQ